jgi:hypothetical protein
VTGEWRKLHSEELHNLYSCPDIIRQIKSRQMRWAGHVACMGEETKLYRDLVAKPEGKRPLRRPRHTWEYGFSMSSSTFVSRKEALSPSVSFDYGQQE